MDTFTMRRLVERAGFEFKPWRGRTSEVDRILVCGRLNELNRAIEQGKDDIEVGHLLATAMATVRKVAG